MAEIKFFLDGARIDEPKNWQDLEISVDFEDDKKITINAGGFIFVGETAIKMIARANKSWFEGSELKIEFGTSYTFFGNLDYSDGFVIVGCAECICNIKQLQGVDWTEEQANSFSMAFLFEKGKVTDADFVKVPYVINYIPDNLQLLTLSISVFMLTKEIIEVVKSVTETVSDLIESVIPNTPSPLPSWSLGKVVALGLKAALETAYAIGISIAIAKMIKEIVEQILPKKRFHLGMKITTVFERGCEHLGLEFSSKQLEKYGDLVLIPSKGFKGGSPEDYDTEAGFLGSGDIGYYFGDFIEIMKGIFYSDFNIIDGVFHFERNDFFADKGNFVKKDIYNNQERLLDEESKNTDELKANYLIKFAFDIQDQNTLDNQDRRVYSNHIGLKVVSNEKLVNTKGGQVVDIPFSLAVRKNSLTRVEKSLKSLLELSDKITGRSDASAIKSRLGSMHMSSHFITSGKFVVMEGDNLATNQRDLINAELLWDNEHHITSFVPINGIHNQYIKFEDEPSDPFCEDDFKELINSRFFPSKNGNFGKMDSFKWKPYRNTAVLNYRINTLYETNLILEKL